MHLKSSRVGYRQWLGFVFQDPQGAELPAAAIDTYFKRRAADLAGKNVEAFRRSRQLVAGYYLDNMKPLEFGEALLPLNVDVRINPAAAAQLAHAWVEAADESARAVGNAVKDGLYSNKAKIAADAAVLTNAKVRFWADTEQDFFTQLPSAIAGLAAVYVSDEALRAHRQATGAIWLAAMRRVALAIFDTVVPIDTADLKDIDNYKKIVEARRFLTSTFAGYTPSGRRLHAKLDQPEKPKPKKSSKAKETAA